MFKGIARRAVPATLDGHMQRRKFLQSAGLIAAGAAAPTILPSRVFGAQAPTNRVNLAFIGTGRQAYGLNLPEFMAVPGVQVVAVCDVDSWRVGPGEGPRRVHLRQADRPRAGTRAATRIATSARCSPGTTSTP